MSTSNWKIWNWRRKSSLVLEILRGREMAEACAANDVPHEEVERWVKTFVDAGQEGLKVTLPRRADTAVAERRIRALTHKVGELVLELDELRGRSGS